MKIIKYATAASLFLALTMFPLYLFPSGSPQISDIFFVLFMIFCFLHLAIIRKLKVYSFPKVWLFLVLLIAVVSFVWSIILQDISPAYNLLFWVFNILVSYFLYVLLRIDHRFFTRVIFLAIYVALFISTVGVLFFSDGSVRSSGFFNNPNQLAYFSLLSLSIVMLIRDYNLNKIYYYPVLIFGLIGILLSASISAILAVTFVLAAYIYKSLTLKSFIGMFILVVVVAISVISIGGETLNENLEARSSRFDTKVESINSERNYDRITDNIEYILLGAGEGGYERFSDNDTHEIHSSYGNLVFSYGVTGLFLFLLLLYRALKGMSYAQSLALFGPLLYSTTHMGLRSTYFWVLIVICLNLKYRNLD